MRKVFVWLAGALGLAALLRALRKRASSAPVVQHDADPADELRSAIADAQAREGQAGEEPPGEPSASLEERRRRVHERAQEAIDSMREPPPGA